MHRGQAQGKRGAQEIGYALPISCIVPAPVRCRSKGKQGAQVIPTRYAVLRRQEPSSTSTHWPRHLGEATDLHQTIYNNFAYVARPFLCKDSYTNSSYKWVYTISPNPTLILLPSQTSEMDQPRTSSTPRTDPDLQHGDNSDKNVPKVGMCFQSEEEAYNFYSS